MAHLLDCIMNMTTQTRHDTHKRRLSLCLSVKMRSLRMVKESKTAEKEEENIIMEEEMNITDIHMEYGLPHGAT